jgi:hypothetical protein
MEHNVLHSIMNMQKATETKFNGLGGCAVELHTYGWGNESNITVRDTERGDSVVLNGVSTLYLRGSIKNYVRDLGYRDESVERRQFLETLATELGTVLSRWESKKAEAKVEEHAKHEAQWES